MKDILLDLKIDYINLLDSGLFFEFYPSLSGRWKTDKKKWIEIKSAEQRTRNSDNSSFFDKLTIEEKLQAMADSNNEKQSTEAPNPDSPASESSTDDPLSVIMGLDTETPSTVTEDDQTSKDRSFLTIVNKWAEFQEEIEKVDRSPITYVETNFPETAKEFKRLQELQYQTFCRKQQNYGPGNISVGTELKTDQEKRVSLTGIWFRINDKINRLKQMVLLGEPDQVGESIQDSFDDISIYGIIAQIVVNGKWGK